MAHGHGHRPAGPAGRGVRIAIAVLLVPAALATAAALVLLAPWSGVARTDAAASAGPRVPGHVTTVTEVPCDEADPDADPTGCLQLTIALTGGPVAGQEVRTVLSKGMIRYQAGDDVVLVQSGDADDPTGYDVVDFQRSTPLAVLAALFAAAVVALGRWRGVAALVALGLSGFVLLAFVLPAILAGRDPLAVAVTGACAIMFGVLYLTHGFSARTSTAVLGTLASLVLIGALGAVFVEAAHIVGASEDVAGLSRALGTAVDGRGLVLAGLVIGALGALDDVTVTQTSAVWELHAADPGMRPRRLFAAAMRIGRDHVASSVNTLVLAYAGAALPLLLLFSVAERGLADTLTVDVIAVEVVRTLVGSIGIVASVPVTTALAVAVVTRR